MTNDAVKTETEKYRSFKELPIEIAEKLKRRIVEHQNKRFSLIPEDASGKELISILAEAHKNPDYTEEELVRITDAFLFFNEAVGRGLPNQLYQMFARVLDTELAVRAYERNAVWYAHEGTELAEDAVREFAAGLIHEIRKRKDWSDEEFHKEYYLIRK